MEPQIYLDSFKRRYFINQIKIFAEIYETKLFPIFENIEEKSEEFYNNIIEELDTDIELDIAHDIAFNKSLKHFEDFQFTKYLFLSSSIVVLYHYWEQQFRNFIFRELKTDLVKLGKYDINVENFRKWGNKDIIDICIAFGINIKSFSCWKEIDEFRTIVNSIKHGESAALETLRKDYPELLSETIRECRILKKECDGTLLFEILDISEERYNKYVNVILSFWDEFPERSYMDNLEKP